MSIQTRHFTRRLLVNTTIQVEHDPYEQREDELEAQVEEELDTVLVGLEEAYLHELFDSGGNPVRLVIVSQEDTYEDDGTDSTFD